MRILVLGAGGTGGYFGGRLAAAGADVTFLVRQARAEQLRGHGLVVKSPFGDLQLAVSTVSRESLQPGYDVVLLSSKAYDLDDAIDAVAPAMGEATVVVPLLNGLRHMAALDQRFGHRRVLGGLCHIAAMLNERGEVLHLNRIHSMTLGARFPEQAQAAEAVGKEFGRGGFDVHVAQDIEREMWEKFVFLTTLAAMTCLMRGSIGEIMATRDGKALMNEALDCCAAVARAAGIDVGAEWLANTRAFLTNRASTMTASMLRDLEAGGRTEADHIVGDMLARAEAAGIPAALLRAAYCHLQTGEARKTR